MSSDTHVMTMFEVSNRGGLELLARSFLKDSLSPGGDHIAADSELTQEGAHLLRHAGQGNGVGQGRCGDMFTFGCVGNYVDIHSFVEGLRPFWFALYHRHIVSPFESIVVMVQPNQQPRMEFYEIRPQGNNVNNGLATFSFQMGAPLLGWDWERPADASGYPDLGAPTDRFFNTWKTPYPNEEDS